MSVYPLGVPLDWLGQLLKDHALIEQQREESGYDPDYDTELPPECFKTTAWEIVVPIVLRCIPGQTLDEKRLREFVAARNLLRPDNPAFLDWTREGKVPEFLAVQGELERLDLGRLVYELRREFDRVPLQKHAVWLDGLNMLVETHASKAAPSTGWAPEQAEGQPQKPADDIGFRVARLYAGGLADEKAKRCAAILTSGKTTNERLAELHAVRSIAHASASDMAKSLGVSPAAVKKSQWWKDNMKGAKRQRANEREENLRQRGDAD